MKALQLIASLILIGIIMGFALLAKMHIDPLF